MARWVLGRSRGRRAGGGKAPPPPRRSWKNAAEEAQRFRERFGAAIGIGHEKCRTPQLVRQISRNESLGDVVQAGDRDMARAGAQSGECALHRRMAKDGLQSLADGRKYHAWVIRIPPAAAGGPRLGFSSEWPG